MGRSRVKPAAKLAGVPAGLCSAKEKKQWRALLLLELGVRVDHWLRLIKVSFTPSGEYDLICAISQFFKGQSHLDPPVPAAEYVSWLFDDVVRVQGLDPRLPAAVSARRKAKEKYRQDERRAMGSLMVYKTAEQYVSAHNTTLHIHLHVLPSSRFYPPPKFLLDDTSDDATFENRRIFFKTKKMPDVRTPRRELHRVRGSKLQLSVPPDASCLVFDADTKELVLSVVRNFSGSPIILKWARDIVTEANDARLSVRVS
jgi:hypothetical protein